MIDFNNLGSRFAAAFASLAVSAFFLAVAIVPATPSVATGMIA